MIDRLSKRREDEGFTLIELLVVIIIIGILAAIAIPVFLNQRSNAWDAAVQADLRNAATAQETGLTDTGLYVAEADMADYGFKYSTNTNYDADTAVIDVMWLDNTGAESADATADGYCLLAVSKSGDTFVYSSPGGLQGPEGAVQPTCP